MLPCIDDVRVVNLRTVTFDVQPQEVMSHTHTHTLTPSETFLDSDQGFSDVSCRRCGLLPNQ